MTSGTFRATVRPKPRSSSRSRSAPVHEPVQSRRAFRPGFGAGTSSERPWLASTTIVCLECPTPGRGYLLGTYGP